MAEILIVYSTTDGHSRLVSERIAQVVEGNGHAVSLASLDGEPMPVIAAFDKIVLGGSIRYGKHSKAIYRFIEENRQLLDSKPNAFFSVNVVARKPEKNQPDTNPYLKKFLKGISWQPKELAVFGGKLDYQSYRSFDRLMIRMIMWMTKGPTDPDTVVDFTDWSQVDKFGHIVSHM